MPEAVQKLDGGVAGEGDESPEHERVRHADRRPLTDRLALQEHVDEEASDAESGSVEREAAGSGGDDADARRHLRHKGADEQQEQQPEQRQRFPDR